MLIILDGWSVHRSEQFRTYMSTNHPNFHLAFLPPNCTSLAQPADTGLQRPIKARVETEFDKYCVRKYLSASKKGISPANFKLDVRMATIKPMLVKWLVDAWLSVKQDKDLVSDAWVTATLHQLRDPQFRARAVRAHGTAVAAISARLATPPPSDEPIESSEDDREHDEASGLHDGEIDLTEGLSNENQPIDSDDELLVIDSMIRNAPDDQSINSNHVLIEDM